MAAFMEFAYVPIINRPGPCDASLLNSFTLVSFVRNPGGRPALGAGACTGSTQMPSSEYFGRQADICMRLSAIASDDEVASRLIAMAHAYTAKAAALEPRQVPAGDNERYPIEHRIRRCPNGS